MTKLTFNRIKEFLAKAGKSNIELAEFLGVHEQTVSAWCTNDNQPAYDKLFKISDFFGVEAGELLTLKKDLRTIRKDNAVKPKKSALKRK